MALQLKIEVTERAANCSGFTVSETTGAYDADANAGGYGTPNPVREDYTAVLMADRVNSTGSTAVDTADTNVSPAKWTVTTEKDGYYDILLVLATPYNGFNAYGKNQVRLYNGSLYVSNDAVPMQRTWQAEELDAVLLTAGIYNADSLNGNVVLQLVSDSDMDITNALADLGVESDVNSQMPVYIEQAGYSEEPDANWTKIVNVNQYPLLAANTGAYYARKSNLVYCHTDKCKLNRDTTFAATDCANCSTDDSDMLAYYQVERAYKGSIYNFGLGNYTKAGDQIEMAQSICESNGGGCNC